MDFLHQVLNPAFQHLQIVSETDQEKDYMLLHIRPVIHVLSGPTRQCEACQAINPLMGKVKVQGSQCCS